MRDGSPQRGGNPTRFCPIRPIFPPSDPFAGKVVTESRNLRVVSAGGVSALSPNGELRGILRVVRVNVCLIQPALGRRATLNLALKCRTLTLHYFPTNFTCNPLRFCSSYPGSLASYCWVQATVWNPFSLLLHPMLPLLLASAAAVASSPPPAREAMPFDYNWRFKRGDPAGVRPALTS